MTPGAAERGPGRRRNARLYGVVIVLSGVERLCFCVLVFDWILLGEMGEQCQTLAAGFWLDGKITDYLYILASPYS